MGRKPDEIRKEFVFKLEPGENDDDYTCLVMVDPHAGQTCSPRISGCERTSMPDDKEPWGLFLTWNDTHRSFQSEFLCPDCTVLWTEQMQLIRECGIEAEGVDRAIRGDVEERCRELKRKKESPGGKEGA